MFFTKAHKKILNLEGRYCLRSNVFSFVLILLSTGCGQAIINRSDGSLVNGTVDQASVSLISIDTGVLSNSDTSPLLVGLLENAVVVNFYSDASCSTSIALSTADKFEGAGVELTFNANSVNTIYAIAGIPGEVTSSDCTYLVSFTHDDIAPDVPEIVVQGGASSGSDSTPSFSVSLEGDGVFELSDVITVHDNATCTNSVAGQTTGENSTSVVIEITSAQSEGSTSYYAMVEDAAGNSSCSEAHSTDGEGTEFATYNLDTTPPDVPEIALQSPASPSTSDSTPSFTVSFELDGNFDSGDTISIHNNATCTNSVSADVTGETGASVVIEVTTAQSEGTTTYYARVEDETGNASCSEAHGTDGNGTEFASFLYDVTAPDVPEIALQSPASSPGADSTPSFTVSFEADGNFDAADTITIHDNSTCSNSVAGNTTGESGSSVVIEVTSAQSEGTTSYYAQVEDAAGNSSCSEAHSTDGNGTEFASYNYDNTAPDVPEITLQNPASSPGTDSTPSFTVSFEADGNFAAADTITIHSNSTCTNSVAGNTTGETGASVVIEVTSAQSEGSTSYYARVEDAAGNSSCSEAHGTDGNGTEFSAYEYDNTAPDVPEIALQSPASSPGNDSTPSFTVSFEADGNFDAADTISIHDNASCTSSVAGNTTAETGASVVIEVTSAQSAGTTSYYARVEDAAGNASCSEAHSTDGNGTEFASYDYDNVAPDVPEIALQSPASSPGADSTPSFTVSFEADGNFDAADTITIHDNASCTSSVAGNTTGETGASVVIEVTSAQALGSTSYYARVEDAAGNSSCSEAHGTDGNGTEFATFEYDNSAPDVPEIALQSPAGSPGNDSTPSFTVSFEGDGNFDASDTITIHDNATCTSSVAGNTTGETGSSVVIEVTSAQSEGSTNYYANVEDAAGNSSCSEAHTTDGNGTEFATYEYDNTPPVYPGIMIAIPGTTPSTDSTPSFTVSLEDGGNFASTDKVSIHDNATCTSLVSAESTGNTGTSVNVAVTSAQLEGTTRYYSKVEDAAGNTSCSDDHDTTGDGTQYADHEYDNTAPDVPEVALQSPASSPGTDSTPSFTVSFEGDGNFAAADTITIHNNATCTSSVAGNTTGQIGASVVIEVTSAQGENSTNYYAKVEDEAGNSSCSDAHSTDGDGTEYATFLYDNTAPTWADSLSLSASQLGSTTATPTITYSSDAADGGSGSGIAAYQYAIDEKSGSCDSSTPDTVSWTTALASGNPVTGLTLSFGSTYCLMMRAVDNVDLASSVLTEEWQVTHDISVAALYDNAVDWMDYVESDTPASETFSVSNAACDGTEANRVDCRHGGEYRKVEISFESDCSGLAMTDTLGAFDWTCVDNGSDLTFLGELKSSKRLQDLLDFATPAFQDNSVTLTGCTDCPLSTTAGAWWNNTVAALPDNSAGAVATLDSSGTIYVLDSSRSSAGYDIDASKVAIVTDSDATLSWNDSGSTNAGCGNVSAMICAYGGSPILYFNWIEATLNLSYSSSAVEYGVYLRDADFTRVAYLDADGAASASGIYGYSTERNTFGSVSVSNTGDNVNDEAISIFQSCNDNLFEGTVSTTDNYGSGFYNLCDGDTYTGNLISLRDGYNGVELRGHNLVVNGDISVTEYGINNSGGAGVRIYSVEDSTFSGDITVQGDVGAVLNSRANGLLVTENSHNNTFEGDISVSDVGDGSGDYAIWMHEATGNVFNGTVTTTDVTGYSLYFHVTATGNEFKNNLNFHSIGNPYATVIVTADGQHLAYDDDTDTSYSLTVNGSTSSNGLRVTSDSNIVGNVVASGDIENMVSLDDASNNVVNSVVATLPGTMESKGVVVSGASSSNNHFKYIDVTSSGTSRSGGVLLSGANSGHFFDYVKVQGGGDGTLNSYGVQLVSTENTVLKEIEVSNFDGHGIIVGSSAKENKFHKLRVDNVGLDGIHTRFFPLSNSFGDVIVSNSEGNGVIFSRSPEYFHFTNVTLVNNASAGVSFAGNATAATGNVLQNTLVSNNGSDGFYLRSALPNTFVNTATTNNGDHGISTRYGTYADFTGVLYMGNNSSGECYTNGTADTGVIEGTCTDTGLDGSSSYMGQISSATLRTGVDISDSFVGQVLSDGTNANENGSGQAAFASSLGWFDFDNIFRSWGQSHADAGLTANHRGPCTNAETCQIFDWSLFAYDTNLLNRSGDGDNINGGTTPSVGVNSFTDGIACPATVNGDQYYETQFYTHSVDYSAGDNGFQVEENNAAAGGNDDGVCDVGEVCQVVSGDSTCDVGETCIQRALLSATEIFGDEDNAAGGGDDDGVCEYGETCLGDEDGLCEEGEACLYTPNVGAYQGHGTLGSCTFSAAGGISVAAMYGYSNNGRLRDGDTTPPATPQIALYAPATPSTTDATPEFTVSLSSGSFDSTDVITVHNSSSCSNRVSAEVTGETGSSVDIEVTTAQAINTSANYYALVKDATGNAACSELLSSGEGTEFATYEYNSLPPDTPAIMIAIPNTTPSSDSTPSFTVSFEGGGNFVATDKITIHSNATCSSLVSAESTGNTGTSVNVDVTSTQSEGTTRYYARVEDQYGSTSCSNDHSTSGDSSQYADHEYDNTPPTAPQIVLLSSSTPTPSNDGRPIFTVTMDNSATFASEGVATLTLHEGADCSGSAVATLNNPAGSSVALMRDASASEGSTVYRLLAEDDAGNTTCSTEHVSDGDDEGEEFATHFYDNTAPTWADSLSLGATTSSSTTDTPTFTYTSNASDGSGSGVVGYEYAIDEKSGTCDSVTPSVVDWTTAPASGNTVGSLSLTVSNTYCFMMRAVDNVGLVSTVVEEEWDVVIGIDVVARYDNATNWMDYVKSDSPASGTFTSTNAACDGTEANRIDCRHGGEYKKVEVGFESDCTGLSMADTLDAFDWTCVDNGADLTFYGQLKSDKLLRDLIDFATPDFRDNAVTLAGCTDCPVSSTSESWWTNTVAVLPNNDGGSVSDLTSTGTIYALDSDQNSPGYDINGDKIAIVTDSDATITWDNSSTLNPGCNSQRCLIGSRGTHYFGWIEADLSGTAASTGITVGTTLHGVSFFRVPYFNIDDTDNTGFWLDGTSSKITLGDITISNTGGSIAHKAFDCSSAVTDTVVNTVTATNNLGYGIYIDCDEFTATGTLSSTGDYIGIYTHADNLTFSNLVSNTSDTVGVFFHTGTNISTGTIDVNGDSGATITNVGNGITINVITNSSFGDITVDDIGNSIAHAGVNCGTSSNNLGFSSITSSNNAGYGTYFQCPDFTFSGTINTSNNDGFTDILLTADSSRDSYPNITSTEGKVTSVAIQGVENTDFGTITVVGDSGTTRNTGSAITVTTTNNVNFGNFIVSDNGDAASDSDITISSGSNLTFSDMTVTDPAGYGLTTAAALDGDTYGNITITNPGGGPAFTHGAHNSTIESVTITGGASSGLRVNGSGNTFKDIFVSGNIGAYAAYFGGARNIIHTIKAFNNGDAVGDYAIWTQSTNYNIFGEVISANNSGYGIAVLGSGHYFNRVTMANNGLDGVYVVNSNGTVFQSVIAVNNDTEGINGLNNYSGTLANAVAIDNGTSGVTFYGSGMGMHGVLMVGGNSTADCLATGLVGATTTTCTTTGTDGSSIWNSTYDFLSNALLRRDTVSPYDLDSTFVGKVTSNDGTNTSDTTGTNTYTLTQDWAGFDYSTRGWGKDESAFPNSDNRGSCLTADTCRIWDWALDRDDSVLLNRSGDGSTANDITPTEIAGDSVGNDNGTCEAGELCTNSFIAGSACPTEVDGDQYTDSSFYTYDSAANPFGANGFEVEEVSADSIGNDDGTCENGEQCTIVSGDSTCDDGEQCVSRFLINAVEILGDSGGGAGDDDGLCEEGEDCLYTPNFGAYQGHGTLGTCTFSDAGGINVNNMYGYPYNGR